jgi:integrase
VILADVARRSYGTGSLHMRRDSGGLETWYGLWWAGDRRIKRRIGPKRKPGTRDGLSRAQAEAKLRKLIEAEQPAAIDNSTTVEEAGRILFAHLDSLGRKRSTLGEYESYLRVHLAPFFRGKPLARIEREDVESFMAAKRREGKAPKSIHNYIGLLHSIFAFAQRRGLAETNPVAQVDKPARSGSDPDIRYLDDAELTALLNVVPGDRRGQTERVLYLTAAMTGLRQGELLGLRWQDIDWSASRVRVRRSYVRGEYGTPKSRRSSRSVPLADVVAGELDQLFKRSAYQRDEDLVFCHPGTGGPLDRSKVLKRFKAAAQGAGLRPVRFHDLRHTFGTRMASAGVPLRTIQEWMGHRDFKTTLLYADYQPAAEEAAVVARAFTESRERDARHADPELPERN